MRVTLAAVVALVALAGCGGSDTPDAVGDCTIAPATACPGADLTGADLEGADLTGSNLSTTNLTDTNLSGANLTDANLSGAQIVGADLSDADLTRANLTGATITGTDLDGAILCGTTRTDGTTDDTSCPATTDTTDTTTTTTTTGSGDAELTSFEVGELACDDAESASVSVAWATENATAVEIALDTAAPAGLGPSGSTNITVACDGAPPAITITPQGDEGPGVPETKQVESG